MSWGYSLSAHLLSLLGARAESPNDLKLSERGARRGLCAGEGGEGAKAEESIGRDVRSGSLQRMVRRFGCWRERFINGALATYKCGIEEAVLLRDAFFLAVRTIHPKLPAWFVRVAVLDDVGVIAPDDDRQFGMNRVHPFAVLRKKGPKLFVCWLAAPVLRWTNAVRVTMPVYRWLKRNRASEARKKGVLETVTLTHRK